MDCLDEDAMLAAAFQNDGLQAELQKMTQYVKLRREARETLGWETGGACVFSAFWAHQGQPSFEYGW
jgi:hypothetical protein